MSEVSSGFFSITMRECHLGAGKHANFFMLSEYILESPVITVTQNYKEKPW